MEIVRYTLIILLVLLVFNLLIFVHELGHFLAARWRGLKVDRFAVWFGAPLWKRNIGGVEYALGWIPAGGYVALPQMAPMEAIEGKRDNPQEALPPISPLDKIIVAIAGPLFSFLLAIVFAVLVWIVGRPVNEADRTTKIGWVVPSGPAWKAGLKPGDDIREIDGHPVTQFGGLAQDSIIWRIVSSEGTNIAVKYARDGMEGMAYPAAHRMTNKWYERKKLRQLQISMAYDAVISEVATNSPAFQAGLRQWDQITKVNGEAIFSGDAVHHEEKLMTNPAAPPIMVTVRRGTEELQVSLKAETPIKPAGMPPSFGIRSWHVNTNVVMKHPDPAEQVRASVAQVVGTLRTLISRKSDVGVQQLGGAVMIIRVYTNLMDSKYGWRLVLWFSVVMNVNLALLNLLPLPVLDGGHITLALMEAIRRRPVSGKLLQYVQTGFAVTLIAFMLFIAFYDTGDWVRSGRKDPNEGIEFAPKK